METLKFKYNVINTIFTYFPLKKFLYKKRGDFLSPVLPKEKNCKTLKLKKLSIVVLVSFFFCSSNSQN